MGRRLLYLANGLLLIAAMFLGVRLYETWSARPPAAPPEAAAPATGDAAPAPQAAPTRPPLTAYAAVAERNLFSATRTEAPPEPPRPATGTGAPVAPPAPRPRLHGIVLLPEGRGRAYLEDVQRRRVFAYSVGDLVGDARLEQIKADRVVLRRGGETFEVLLYDPAKPRQAAAPSGVQSPETGAAGRPVIRRPPAPTPSPGTGAPRLPGGPARPHRLPCHLPARRNRSRTRKNDRPAGASPNRRPRPRRPGRVRRTQSQRTSGGHTPSDAGPRGDRDGGPHHASRAGGAGRPAQRPAPDGAGRRRPGADARRPPARRRAGPGAARTAHHAPGATRAPDRSQLRQCRYRGGHPGGQRDRRVQLHDRPGRGRQEGDDPDVGPDPGGRGLQRPPGRAGGQRRHGHPRRQPLQDPADDRRPRAAPAHRHRRPGGSHPPRRRGDHADRAAPARPGGPDRGHAPALRTGRQPGRSRATC